MKKNPVSIIVGGLLLLIFVILLFVYQVRTTEVAVITTFGKPTGERTLPGAYFQWPWPINKVYKLDKRTRSLEIPLQQSTTADENSLLVMSYMGWAIEDPKEFFPRFARGSSVAAESALKEMLLNAQKQVVGKHRLQDLISLDTTQLKFTQMEQEMLEILRAQCKSQKYGIDVQFVHIKRLGLPEGTTTAVLDRMSAERRQLVTQIQSEGAAEAAEIRTKAAIQAQSEIAQANSTALRIRGEGEAEVTKILAVFEKDPKLAIFLNELEALQSLLSTRATVIMDPTWPLVELLTPDGANKRGANR